MPAYYVTSLAPGEGKTAVAAGLACLAAAQGKRIGYFKPVALVEGREWTGDPDTSFCRRALGLDETVALAPRAETPDALKNGLGPEVRQATAQRWGRLSAGKDAIFVEGLPSGGVAAAASGQLAELLDARAVAVVRFHRGMDLARAAALRNLFGDRFLGVILNAVPYHSQRVARDEAAPALRRQGVPVLGTVPEERLLLGFTVGDYALRLGGRLINGQEGMDEIVESILMGALVVDSSEFYYSRKANKAVVTRADRPDLQWNALESSTRCLILTGGGDPVQYVQEKAAEVGVPLIVAPKSTLETVAEIEALVTSPIFHHPKKLARFAELLRANVDLPAFGL